MKKRKLLLSLLFAAATALGAAGTAFADSSVTASLSADKTSVTPGEVVTVTVTVAGSLDGIASGQFGINYDDNAFEYKGGSVGAAGSGAVIHATDPKVILVGYPTDASLRAGTLATFTFAAKSDAAASFTLEALPITMADSSNTQVPAADLVPASGSKVDVEVHTHSYAEAWSFDASGHWHECACGAKSGEAAHSMGDWVVIKDAEIGVDGSKQRTCSVCDYVEDAVVPALHEHEFSEAWSCDKSGHWHACAVEGCQEKGSYAEHDFGEWTEAEGDLLPAGAASAKVRTCSVCGLAEYDDVVSAEPEGSDGSDDPDDPDDGKAEASKADGTAKTGDAAPIAAAACGAIALVAVAGMVIARRKRDAA